MGHLSLGAARPRDNPLAIIPGEGDARPHGGHRSGAASIHATQKAGQEDGETDEGVALTVAAGDPSGPSPGEGASPGQEELDGRALERLARGEAGVVEDLVDRYGRRIYNFASRMCRSSEDAKDILQETFLAAVRGLEDFRGEGKLSTWLFRIAANACRKMRRRGKFEPARHLSLEELLPREGDLSAALGDSPETPEAALLRTDLREALESAIADLPAPYRAVLILRDLEGLSTDETAEVLELTPIAVRVRLHRARLFLRQRLAGRPR